MSGQDQREAKASFNKTNAVSQTFGQETTLASRVYKLMKNVAKIKDSMMFAAQKAGIDDLFIEVTARLDKFGQLILSGNKKAETDAEAQARQFTAEKKQQTMHDLAEQQQRNRQALSDSFDSTNQNVAKRSLVRNCWI